MGATKSKSTDLAQGTPLAAPTPDQYLGSYAVSQLPGSDVFKMRFAGDRLTDISPVVSMSEVSQKSKYAPGQVSKAPGSQYLATASAPVA